MGEATVQPAVVEADIPFGEADGRPLLLDIVRPAERPPAPRPAIVHIHGGGWMEGSKGPGWNWFLAARGFFVVSISYRLSHEATFPACLHDCKAGVRWLRANADRYGLDPARVGVWGHSAGGHLAALLGVTENIPALEGNSGSLGHSSRVQAVVALSPPADFLRTGGRMINDADSPVTRLFGGMVHERAELMRLAGPVNHVRGDAPPFLIVHGERDDVVPIEQAHRLHEALSRAGGEVAFVPLAGVGHDFGMLIRPDDPALSPTSRTILDFFDRHLRGCAG